MPTLVKAAMAVCSQPSISALKHLKSLGFSTTLCHALPQLSPRAIPSTYGRDSGGLLLTEQHEALPAGTPGHPAGITTQGVFVSSVGSSQHTAEISTALDGAGLNAANSPFQDRKDFNKGCPPCPP